MGCAKLAITFIVHREDVLLTWAWWLACTNSGLGQPDPVSPENDCPIAGRWELTAIQCGAFDFVAATDRYDGIVLTAAEGGMADCLVDVRLTGLSCGANVTWSLSWSDDDPQTATLLSDGVLACEPGGCTFDDGSACLVGAGRGDDVVQTDVVEGQLIIDGAFADLASELECPLGLTATFLPL